MLGASAGWRDWFLGELTNNAGVFNGAEMNIV